MVLNFFRIEDSSGLRKFFTDIFRLAAVEAAILLTWIGFWWSVIYVSVAIPPSPESSLVILATVILLVGSLVVGLKIGDNLSRIIVFLRHETVPSYSDAEITANSPSGEDVFVKFQSIISKCWAICIFYMLLFIFWGALVILFLNTVDDPATALSNILQLIPEPVINSLLTTLSNLTGLAVQPLFELITSPETLIVGLIVYLPILLFLTVIGLNMYHMFSIWIKSRVLPPTSTSTGESYNDR